MTTSPSVVATILEQLGAMNLFAISGGRVVLLNAVTVSLPVSAGYAVEIEYLVASDLYEVRRVRTLRRCRTVFGAATGLYWDQMPQAAYVASCHVDLAFP
jgi:hypothetical protein